MQDASQAEMRRQIRREGRRWGLVPVLRDGHVAVGQRTKAFKQFGEAPGYTSDAVFYVADVTMAHGFIGVLMNQKKLEERDAANARADKRQAAIAKADADRYDDMVSTYDADAQRLIAKMGWDEFINALIGPDPRPRKR